MNGWDLSAMLRSKSFWAGVGLACLAVYQATQGHYDQAVGTGSAALGVWGIRHAIAKQGGPGDPPYAAA